MVVEVVYHRDDTFLSFPGMAEEGEGRVLDSSMASHRMHDVGRDTSHTNRDGGDDTRQSFHTSILNCTGDTEDEDDDVEEPGSFLFDDDDFRSPLNQSLEVPEEDASFVETASPAAPCSPTPQKSLCCVNERQWWLDTSLQNVTDSFVSLCSSRPEEACGFSDFVLATETCSRQLQHQVEIDLLQLLGCDDPTSGGAAGDAIWFSPLLIKSSPATNTNAVRRNPRQRAERIRRLRNELLGEHHTHHRVISPTRSVDDHARMESWIGRGMDPIEQDNGYDSDPGEVLQETPCDTLRDTSLLDDEETEDEYHFYDGHRARVADEYNMRALYRGPKDEYDREIYEAVQVRFHYEVNGCLCLCKGTMLTLSL